MALKRIEINFKEVFKFIGKYSITGLFTLGFYPVFKFGMYRQRVKDAKYKKTSGVIIDGNINRKNLGVCIAYK